MDETKVTQRDGERYHSHVLEESNIVIMATLQNAVYIFSASPMKVPMAFFTDDRKKFFYNLYGNRKDLKEACSLERKRSDGGFRLPDFSLYYRAIVISAAWN